MMQQVLTTVLNYLSKHRWPGILWTTLIFVACLSPSSGIPKGPSIPGIDKWVHIGIFAIWSGIWTSFRSTDPTQGQPLPFWKIIIVGGALGLGIEFMQEFSALGRAFEWMDLLADLTGVVLGYFIRRSMLGSNPISSTRD